jgi:hypothetical protein
VTPAGLRGAEKRLRDFNVVLDRILKRHVSVVMRIAVGIMEIKQQVTVARLHII